MITGIITGQDLRLGVPIIAADTLNYLTAKFVFKTDAWNGLIKIAHFSNGEDSADIELTDDAILAEDGLNLSEGKWQLSVTGHEISGGEIIKRITTTVAEFTVKRSGVPDGEPLPSLPSYGEEILAEVRSIQGDVTEQLEAQDAAVAALLDANELAVSAQLQNQNEAVTEQLIGQDAKVTRQLAEQDAAIDSRLDENEAAVAAMLGKVKNERDGSFIKLWSGSEAQYAAAAKNADTIYLVGLMEGDE